MNESAADTQGAVSSPAPRPSRPRGVLGSVRMAARDFFRQFANVLSSFTCEYESRRRFLGWPLLSISVGRDDPKGTLHHARGLMAIGNRATGLIAIGIFRARGVFAIGLVAVGLGTVGVAGLGLICVSVVGLGLVSVAVFAAGYLAVGILAVGYKCVGIVAIGHEAVGIIAVGDVINPLFSP